MEVQQDSEPQPDASAPKKSFSFGRVGFLLLIVVAVFVARGAKNLPKLFEDQRAREAQEQEHQKQLQKQVEQLQQSVADGQGGEALNRLFGVDPEEAARRRKAANQSSANPHVEQPPPEQEPLGSR